MSRFSRRQFVKSGAAGSAALAIGFTPWQRVRGANDRINAAVVGIRSRGNTHIGALPRCKNTSLVALCDVDSSFFAKKKSSLEKKFKHKVDTYVDIRELLERKDIDVVSLATPNHVHSLHSIWAMQAGKDVYCEKPVSHNVWEGRQMVNAARKLGRICQTGTQSRSSVKSIGEAVKFVQSGELGKIQYAVGTCFKPRKSIGKLDKPLALPSSLNYDLWCGPAAKVDLYRPKIHYDWHWDYNTGNGDMGNQGIHQMDIARWFLGEKQLAPRTLSLGGRFGYDDAGNTANTQTVLHDYDKAPLIFETRGLPQKDLNWKTGMPNYRGSRVGVIVQCENGHVVIPNYYSATAYDSKGEKVKSWRTTDPTTPHFQNFIGAVRSRKHTELNADIEEGHISSALCHTGGMSHVAGVTAKPEEIKERIKGHKEYSASFDRMAEHLANNGIKVKGQTVTLGAVLEFDVNKEQVTNDKKAAKLITRDYRKGFEVPNMA